MTHWIIGEDSEKILVMAASAMILMVENKLPVRMVDVNNEVHICIYDICTIDMVQDFVYHHLAFKRNICRSSTHSRGTSCILRNGSEIRDLICEQTM